MSDKEINTEDSVEERVVQKINNLRKIVTIKKQLSEKQQAHLDKLAKGKKGVKYVKQVPETEVELPTEIIQKKVRAPRVKVVEPEISEESEVVIVKKKKKRVEVIEESSSEESEEPVKKPKKKTKAKTTKLAPVKKAAVKKAPVKKVPEPIEEQNQFKSLFNKRLF